MKRNLSLRAKISLLIALPLVALTVLIGFDIKKQVDTLIDVATTDRNIKFLESLSTFVHQTQTERGLSIEFLDGVTKLSELNEQRKQVDDALNKLKPLLDKTSIPAEMVNQFKRAFQSYATLRAEITDHKLSAHDATSKYTELVGKLTSAYNPVVNASNVSKIKSRVRSSSAMELANESVGQLRVQLTNILSKNEPVSNEALTELLESYSKVEANLQSPALVVPPEVAAKIKSFHTSDELRFINQTVLLVISQSAKGHFGQDPKTFFDHSSKAMDKIQEIIQGEFDEALKVSDEETHAAQTDLIIMSVLLLAVGIILISLSVWTIRSISNGLESIMLRLTKGSDQVASAAQQIATHSSGLSETVTEQAAAIQETVASVDEIQAMVEKNRDAANRSKQTSTESTRASRSGKESVDKMIEAISEISRSTAEMAQQMEQGNREIEEIVKVISEIGNKTKVINDIVFQTKLLSFNASVEAARAGEHGKGFSVVAEEVGNLAQMSGTAAKEISSMLEGGIKKVEQIVQTTRGRLTQMAANSKERVNQGRTVAGHCGEALDAIMTNVASLDSLVSEISVASDEQAQGVNEVTKAMSQLDQVTQQNATTAQHSASAGEALNNQSHNLNLLVSELSQIITGADVQPTATAKIQEVKPKEVVKPIAHIKQRVAPKAKTTRAQVKPLKAVAGGVPSENDPGFEDV